MTRVLLAGVAVAVSNLGARGILAARIGDDFVGNFTGVETPVALLEFASGKLNCWICVTNGAEGNYFIEDGCVENIPAIAVEVRETLGAGDVWHGAFAVMIAEGQDVRSAIRFTNASRTLKCARPGGPASSPGRLETEQFLTTHSKHSGQHD